MNGVERWEVVFGLDCVRFPRRKEGASQIFTKGRSGDGKRTKSG